MYVSLRRTRTLAEATLLRTTLEASGVPVRLVGEQRGGILGEIPVPDAMVDVRVDAAHVLVAEGVLSGLEVAARRDAWVCTRCAEENPGEFDLCWRCGADRLG